MPIGFEFVDPGTGDTLDVSLDQIEQLIAAGYAPTDFTEYEYVEEEPIGPSEAALKLRGDFEKSLSEFLPADRKMEDLLKNEANIRARLEAEKAKPYRPTSLEESMDPAMIRNLQKSLDLLESYKSVQNVMTDEEAAAFLESAEQSPNRYTSRASLPLLFKEREGKEIGLREQVFPEASRRAGLDEGVVSTGFGAVGDVFSLPGRSVRAGIASLEEDPILTPGEVMAMPSRYKTPGQEAFDALLQAPGLGAAGAGAKGLRSAAAPLIGKSPTLSTLAGVPSKAQAFAGNIAGSPWSQKVLRASPGIAGEVGFEATRPEDEFAAPELALLAGLGGSLISRPIKGNLEKYQGFYPPKTLEQISGEVPKPSVFGDMAGTFKEQADVSMRRLNDALQSAGEEGVPMRSGQLSSTPVSDLANHPMYGKVFRDRPVDTRGLAREDIAQINAALKKATGRNVTTANIGEASINEIEKAMTLTSRGSAANDFLAKRANRVFDYKSPFVNEALSVIGPKRMETFAGASKILSEQVDDIQSSKKFMERLGSQDPKALSQLERMNMLINKHGAGLKEVDIVPDAVLRKMRADAAKSGDNKLLNALDKYTRGAAKPTLRALRRSLDPAIALKDETLRSLPVAGALAAQKISPTEERWKEYLLEQEAKRAGLLGGQ